MKPTQHLDRRHFIKCALGTTAALASGIEKSLAITCSSSHTGNPLRLPPTFTNGGDLVIAPTQLDIWPGHTTDVFSINGAVPSPTIRVTKGQHFQARVINNLTDQDLVLHWHGLLAPERMDGHPRDQIAPGESYDIDFKIVQCGATCWYHSHTDMLTAEQVYMGLAGFFIIDDPEIDALGLPSGDHDVPLVFSDWRSNASFQLTYSPNNADRMRGYLGDTALVNGTPDAYLCVDQDLYRFRILNGANARIYKLAFSDNRSFQIIGTEGGLHPAPITVTTAIITPGQRFEILVDFSNVSVGGSVTLRSLGVPRDAGPPSPAQNLAIDLITFHVDLTSSTASAPSTLIPMKIYQEADAVITRKFTLSSSMMTHYINGKLFELERIDFEPTQRKLELWEYENTGNVYHPMHMHAAHFQVLERVGTATLPPEDMGWKDVVLVYPGETVKLLVSFDAHPGKFLHHCHNLEHEDTGMMQNFAVLPAPEADLQVSHNGTDCTISWSGKIDAKLESSPDLSINSWQPVTQTPNLIDGRYTVTLPQSEKKYFYRLEL